MDHPDIPLHPINSTAARVIRSGYCHIPDMDQRQPIWDIPPETKQSPKGTIDMTGTKRGKMTIIGYYGSKKSGTNNYHQWIARCVCGRYEIRIAQKFRRRKDDDSNPDCCQICQYIRRLKNNHV